MKILKEHLETLWYEDEKGNKIPCAENEYCPNGAVFQVSRFPHQLTTNHLKLISQDEVNKCNHPHKYVVPTYGWVDGIVGRECKACYGTQVKKKWHLWPREWKGYGSRNFFSVNQGWNEELALALVNSKEYTLSEAIIIAATSCERCMNALAHKYGLNWGYEEYSEEWQKCGTSCIFCID
ncbi:MAG: hypothetical protein N3I35_18660 [Clostridia bacterium]|nr:hypothetical protein [Clostridia bacterium]